MLKWFLERKSTSWLLVIEVLMIELYAKTEVPLEEVALKFVKCGNMKGLRFYLEKKLDVMDSKLESQVVMLSSWILELLLTDLDIKEDDLRLESGKIVLDIGEVVQYLKSHQSTLNPSTVYSLFNRHGRQNLSLIYAEMIKDYDTLTQLYLHTKSWSEALKVIGSTTLKPLYYKHSPILIQHIPTDLITLWRRCPFLNPRMLLPAMLQYELISTKSTEIINYLQDCIEMGNEDRVIHNYLFYLYVKRGDEDLVVKFIKSRDPPLFDTQYALRITTVHKMLQASIQLVSGLCNYSIWFWRWKEKLYN
jgi:vacuolar protein sorting-associated protein 18